jgi:class 3 adenylate cyclase
MAEPSQKALLARHAEFDSLLSAMAAERDADKIEAIRVRVWEKFGTEGAAFISDMASFSSTSRKFGVCHFMKLIHRARHIIGPIITENRGTLLKFDADNSFSYFPNTDDAIRASFEINAAVFASNDEHDISEQIYISVGIDYGRLLLIGDGDFFGDPVNTASKLAEDLAIRAEVLITERALERSTFKLPDQAERMVARISEIEIKYVRLAMTEVSSVR